MNKRGQEDKSPWLFNPVGLIMTISSSPKTFPVGTRFAVYAGLPLSLSSEDCVAWDRPGGRAFYKELFTLGRPCSEGEFIRAIDQWSDANYRRESGKSIPIVLPAHFPEGTEFGDYENTPLTEFKKAATRWDRAGGQRFSSVDFFSKASPCSEEKFRELVAVVNTRRYS